jgi:outer membrane receptor protein involved in Fe transport
MMVRGVFNSDARRVIHVAVAHGCTHDRYRARRNCPGCNQRERKNKMGQSTKQPHGWEASHADGRSQPILEPAFADYANTLRAPGYTLFGVQTGINWANGVSLFLDARNLTNRHYVSDISTITDARRVGTAVFYPGQGRSLFGGVRYVF